MVNTAGSRAFFMEQGGINVVLKAEQVGSLFGYALTNSLVMAWVVMAILIIFALLFRRTIALIPGRLQAGIEWLFEGVLGYMTGDARERARRTQVLPAHHDHFPVRPRGQ